VKGIRVADTAWPEIEAQLAAGAVAILPVGAASKEHGRHLPLDTDCRQAEWIATQVAQRLSAVVWPTVTYGYYPVFVDYPGSISLREDTFVALVADILDGISRAGASRSVILNTGISTIAPLASLIGELAEASPCRLVNVYAGAEFNRIVEAVSEQSWGGHADEIETSIMLALDPAVVRLDAARPGIRQIVRGLFSRTDRESANYSPDGVNGDPTLATRAKGEQLLAAMVADVVAAIGRR